MHGLVMITKVQDIECNHNLSDPTTVEEQAAYVVYYVDNGITKVARDVFGSIAVGGDAAGVAEYALSFIGQGHSTFTSRYGDGDWCAMFVSYCFEQMGLIPDVLPASYVNCNTGVSIAKQAGKFREASSGYIPKSGDIIFYTKNGSTSYHTGIVTYCDGIHLRTVEGNTGDGNSWKERKVEEKNYRTVTSSDILRIFGDLICRRNIF